MDRFSHWLRPAVMYRRRSWRGRTPAAAAPEPAMVSVPTTVPKSCSIRQRRALGYRW